MVAPFPELQVQVVEQSEESQDKIALLFEKIQSLKAEVLNIKEINKILKSTCEFKKPIKY